MTESTLAIDSRRFSLIFQDNEISNGPMNIIEYGLYEGCLVHMIAKSNTGQDWKRENNDIQLERKLAEFMELVKLNDPEKYQSMLYEYMAMHASHVVIGHDTETERTTLSIKSPEDDHQRGFFGITFIDEENPGAVPKRLDTHAWKLIPITDHCTSPEEEDTEGIVATSISPISIKFDTEIPNSITPLPTDSHEAPIILEKTQADTSQCFCCKKKLRLTN